MRKSGILLAVSSLPSEFGIGTLGEGALRFVDFLASAGQYYWQILPVNPPGFGNSPYQAHSAFAGNHFFVDPGLLQKDGLMSEDEVRDLLSPNKEKVDYSLFGLSRLEKLKKAASRVNDEDAALRSFEEENAFWLGAYCEYMALKEKNDMKGLSDWKKPFEFDEKTALVHKKLQFLFFRQWNALRKYANRNGVHIIGDIPIYVSADSADFFSHPELFLTDSVGNPSRLAGCPPDSFAKKGQLWGNPVYDWEKMGEDGYSWWKKRFEISARMFDVVRIDHFRGFYEYYSVPAGSRDAVSGEWRKGPGMKIVSELKKSFPSLGIIAEDLGFLTRETREFFKESGFPGMKILQFAFDEPDSEYLPHNHEKNCVVYTGTHDNPTTLEWICTAEKSAVCRAMDYFGAESVTRLCDFFLKAALRSPAETAIIPLSDWLKKGKDGRMNTPSTVKNNWEFRIRPEELSKSLSKKILDNTIIFSRTQEEQK